ncbi:dihydropteroate synthase [Sulfitobacter albidus]|uniref:Dihydropteroate synthase n=1 Tax=Sulfitobacter albidus TaxID=2829501 RepID=A0A975JET3_9RHOB|nr:dihydropteroate synthase [Sulfitobacter albidus]QUJ77182.1 dihydropteroate synthase [Sulfitobacter albidus]
MILRPVVSTDVARPEGARTLAGGWGWFDRVELLRRDAPPEILRAQKVGELEALTAPRALFGERPTVMGIVNATPDSFSDGGLHAAAEDAVRGGLAMAAAGAAILDIGGESTRPGAAYVPAGEEIERVVPVIAGLRAAGFVGTISIDTRKAAVGEAALAAGADLINDVSGFTHEPALADVAAAARVPVCVMHAQGYPATMQQNPRYDDVLHDVYDHLAARIAALEAAGIPRARIIADPGIGFGKTQAHNLALLARISAFHGLGVPILLGASRKRFIGTIGAAPEASDRAPGSIAVALAALGQGVQILRVHDVAQTVQAISLWRATVTGYAND